MRLLKLIVALVILAAAGLAGYAYFGDMEPERREVRVPVTLPGAGDRPPPTDAATEAAPADTAADPTATPAAGTAAEAPANGGTASAGTDALD